MPTTLTDLESDRLIADMALLRRRLRQSKKLSRRMERVISNNTYEGVLAHQEAPAPPEPRWLLTGAQLRFIAGHIRIGDAGTYAMMAQELGIDGDLYAMIAETYSAACRLSARAQDKGTWLESYMDAKHAYAWHQDEADAHAAHRAKE